MKKRILIVEDDVLISEQLRIIVNSLGHEVCQICPSLSHVDKFLVHDLPDAALLDIRMNGLDEGIEVAKKLRKLGVPFAFITSFSDKETLMEAVIQQPVGYVVKPYSRDDVAKVIEKAILQIKNQVFTFKDGTSLIRIKVTEIIWMRSENVYLSIFLKEKKYVIREKLENIIAEINMPNLIRVHRSFAVNLNFVSKVGKDYLVIENEEIPVSRRYKYQLDQIFKD